MKKFFLLALLHCLLIASHCLAQVGSGVLPQNPVTGVIQVSQLLGIVIFLDAPVNTNVIVGGTVSFEAVGIIEDATQLDGTSTADITGAPPGMCIFTSSDPTKLSIGAGADPQVATAVATGTVNVSCSLNGVTSNTIAITVLPSNLNITAATLPSATVGSAYTFTFNATGGTPAYTWTCTAGCAALTSAGLSLSSAGVLSGTPTGPAGRYPFVVKVTDAGANTATLGFNVIVFGASTSGCNPSFPCPEPPRVFLTTTYSLPVGGTTWAVHDAASFTSALSASAPGDVIVLDAGTTYSGNFTLPAKTNPGNKWIYIISSALASLPAAGACTNPHAPPAGTCLSPSSAAFMPKITTTIATPPVTIVPGANHWRMAGIEVTSNSTKGCQPTATPPQNCFSYEAVYIAGTSTNPVLPDSVTIDRCYIHGTPTQDIRVGVLGNGSNIALVDNYISEIHQGLSDSYAFGAYAGPGPFKIVDNYLSATTEDIIFGGGGGPNNLYVPSDIEFQHNYLFKPLAWEAVGITIQPGNKWVTKDNFELKSARRALINFNVMENNWKSGQLGASILFTIRSGQSGNIAVVDDITFTNNLIKNVNQGYSLLAADYSCGTPAYPLCTNPGETKRLWVYNNLVLLKNPAEAGYSANPYIVTPDQLTDFAFQHNTVVPFAGSTCFQGIFFNILQGTPWPPPVGYSSTHNVWFMDNVFCRQTTGANGAKGSTGLGYYMYDPPPPDPRYLGNVMFAPAGETVQTWPAHNDATATALTYVSPGTGNYQLSVPTWNGANTSDGVQAGIIDSTIAH